LIWESKLGIACCEIVELLQTAESLCVTGIQLSTYHQWVASLEWILLSFRGVGLLAQVCEVQAEVRVEQ